MRYAFCAFALVLACRSAYPSEVLDAIAKNDVQALREMLARDPSLANPGQEHHHPRLGPPLVYASRLGRNECIAALLDAGADLTVRSRYGLSPLTAAATGNQPETLRLLLARGADARTADRDTSPLLGAAGTGCAEGVIILIEAGADPMAEVRGRSPLSAAAAVHDHEIIRLLLDKLPYELIASASRGDADALARHIAAGDKDAFFAPLEALSAAHAAASADSVECLKLLDMAGFDLFAANSRGATPLHFAASAGSIASAEYLLSKSASLEAASWMLHTPLWSAAWRSQVDMVRYLVERGASTTSRNIEGRTLLSMAIMDGNPVLAHALLDAGADVNLPDLDGNTPLHRVLRQFFFERYLRLEEDDPAFRELERLAVAILKRGALTRTINDEERTPASFALPRHRSMLAQWERRSPETARDHAPEERRSMTGLKSVLGLPQDGYALVIVPVGKADIDLVSKAAEQMKFILGIPVVVEPKAVELDPRRLISRESQGRTQLYAESVVAAVVARMGWHGRRSTAHIAVLEDDIYSPGTNYVFAIPVSNCGLAVLSYSRFGSGQRELLEARLRKQLMASFGRIMPISTCSDRRCPLSTTAHLDALDAKFDIYCDSCSDNLEKLLGRRPRPFAPAGGPANEDVF